MVYSLFDLILFIPVNIFSQVMSGWLLLGWTGTMRNLICHACHVCFLQPCGHLLGKGWPLGSLVYDVLLCFVTFPYRVLGHVWYLIISISDLCLRLYLFKDNMQFHLWGTNKQSIYIDSSTLPLGTALAYCVVITMKVSDYCYDLGVKGQGQMYFTNFDVNSFFIFVRGCAYIAKWFLKVDALKWRFQRTNMILRWKVKVFRIGPTARNMNFCILR